MLDWTRQLYNAALQERRHAYRMRGIAVSAKQQYAELTALRKPCLRLDLRLAAVYREVEDAVLAAPAGWLAAAGWRAARVVERQ